MSKCRLCGKEDYDNLNIRDYSQAGPEIIVCLNCTGLIIAYLASREPPSRLCRLCGLTSARLSRDSTHRYLCECCARILREETREAVGLPPDDTPRLCGTCAHQRRRPGGVGLQGPYCAVGPAPAGVGGWPDAPNEYGCDSRWVPRLAASGEAPTAER